MTLLARRSLLLLLLAAAPAAQSVLVVDGSGGAQFTTLAAAVAEAHSGDVLLVREGFYAEQLRIDGKGIVVHAEAGAQVSAGSLIVSNVPAGEFLAVRGVSFTSNARPITITSCEGAIWLEDLSVFAQTPAMITGSEHVVLRDVGMQGFVVSPSESGACLAIDSALSLFLCGAVGGPGTFGLPVPGQDALWMGRIGFFNLMGPVSAWIYGGSFQGGDGGSGGSAGGGAGGAGVEVTSGSLVQVLDASVSGGAGGGGAFPGAGGQPFEVVDGTVVPWPQEARSVSVPSPVREGATALVAQSGVAGDRVWNVFSTSPGTQRTAPQWIGPKVIGPKSFGRSLGTLDASGSLQRTITVPPLAPGRDALVLVNQPFLLDAATRRFVVGAPTLLLVLDERFAAPDGD